MRYWSLLLTVFLLVGCAAQSIESVKTEEKIGKKVTVTGTVKSSIKIGSISAYVLEDNTGTIGVSAERLPVEGERVTAKGVLIKDSLFGYYIKAD